MNRRAEVAISNLLAECADQIKDGSTVAACLARYPEHATELEPLLLALVEVRQLRPVPARSAELAQQRRTQFMMAAQQMTAASAQPAQPAARIPVRPGTTADAWWERLAGWLMGNGVPGSRPVPMGVLTLLLVVLIGGLFATTIVDVSARALPGDILYPVKMTVEDLRLTLMRDPVQRNAYQSARDELRREEARTVADTGREVHGLTLQGQIEAIHSGRWVVSGLEVLITRDTRIIGTPALGATVDGTMTAPGDYTLVAVYVEIEPPAAPAGAPPATSALTLTPTPTATGQPTATPTAPTTTPAASLLQGGRAAARAPFYEPTDLPTATPTFTPTRTRIPQPTATPTVMPTPSATSTDYPTPAREVVKGRIIGWVKRIEGNLWTIDAVTVECNGSTQFIGQPGVGSQVEAIVQIRPNGSYLGLSIKRISPPDATATPAPVEFTDVVNAINGELWTIGGTVVKVTGETLLENNPVLGDMVSVKAELRENGEIVALRISALREVEVFIQGVIESMSGAHWVVSGTRVIVDGATKVNGTPEVGATVQIVAIQQPDGTVRAKTVSVIAPAPKQKAHMSKEIPTVHVP